MNVALFYDGFRITPFNRGEIGLRPSVVESTHSLQFQIGEYDKDLRRLWERSRREDAELKKYVETQEAAHLFMTKEKLDVIGMFLGEPLVPGGKLYDKVLVAHWNKIRDRDVYVRLGRGIAIAGGEEHRWAYQWRETEDGFMPNAKPIAMEDGFLVLEEKLSLSEMKRIYKTVDRFTRTLEGYAAGRENTVIPSLYDVKVPEMQQLNTLISRCGQ